MRELLGKVKDRSTTFPEGNYALVPGNSNYSDEFISAWHKPIPKEEVQEINNYLLKFVEKELRMTGESDNDE